MALGLLLEEPHSTTDSSQSFDLIFFLFFFSENGLLSYENPNYHLDPARLDDALNSNLISSVEDDLYEEIISELDTVCNLSGRGRPGSGSEGRKSYAALDITSMGVDVNTGPVTNLDSNKTECDNR